MITGVIKNKVDKIWTDIWAGGITNPLTVIEQLTYLMFIRSLDEKELETEEFEHMTGEKMEKIFPQSAVGQSMRWSKFKNNDPRDIFNVISQRVFPAIKNMKHGRLPDFTEQGELVEIADDSSSDVQNETAFARYMSDAMFLIPTPQVLQKIITGLDDLYEHDIADLDMQGDLYEYMLGKLATAGQNGQFRTPKHIREMMVELLQPTPNDTICDPACGTAGFLAAPSPLKILANAVENRIVGAPMEMISRYFLAKPMVFSLAPISPKIPSIPSTEQTATITPRPNAP